jgi:hypothetical protein
MTMTTEKKLPSWLTLTEDGASIKLRKAVECNGVKVNTLNMRAPCVLDVRQATQQSAGDDEKREVILLASLADVGTKDVEGLTVVDYNRLQAGYFRLVEDDEPYPYDAASGR